MDYEQARSQIQTGDAIFVRDVHGLLGRATVFFTRKPHTHAGLAVWLGGRLFLAGLNSGRNHLTAMSQYAALDVCDPPPGLDRAKIEEAIFDMLAKPINYGMLAFVMIGILSFFRIKVFVHWRQILVCSSVLVKVYQAVGWGEHSFIISPGDLYAELPKKLAVGY